MQLKKDDLEKAMQIRTFLEENYKEHYDYECLSKKFGINLLKLKYAFKEVSGESIHVYLTKVRIEKAKELLQTTDETIIRIASMVGLNKSNLNIQFKKITGTTPLLWRKMTYNNRMAIK